MYRPSRRESCQCCGRVRVQREFDGDSDDSELEAEASELPGPRIDCKLHRDLQGTTTIRAFSTESFDRNEKAFSIRTQALNSFFV